MPILLVVQGRRWWCGDELELDEWLELAHWWRWMATWEQSKVSPAYLWTPARCSPDHWPLFSPMYSVQGSPGSAQVTAHCTTNTTANMAFLQSVNTQRKQILRQKELLKMCFLNWPLNTWNKFENIILPSFVFSFVNISALSTCSQVVSTSMTAWYHLDECVLISSGDNLFWWQLKSKP